MCLLTGIFLCSVLSIPRPVCAKKRGWWLGFLCWKISGASSLCRASRAHRWVKELRSITMFQLQGNLFFFLLFQFSGFLFSFLSTSASPNCPIFLFSCISFCTPASSSSYTTLLFKDRCCYTDPRFALYLLITLVTQHTQEMQLSSWHLFSTKIHLFLSDSGFLSSAYSNHLFQNKSQSFYSLSGILVHSVPYLKCFA